MTYVNVGGYYLPGLMAEPYPKLGLGKYGLLRLRYLKEHRSTVWQEYIERLTEYMAFTGTTYKSHAAAIRRWAKENKRKGKGASDYSCNEGESL